MDAGVGRAVVSEGSCMSLIRQEQECLTATRQLKQSVCLTFVGARYLAADLLY